MFPLREFHGRSLRAVVASLIVATSLLALLLWHGRRNYPAILRPAVYRGYRLKKNFAGVFDAVTAGSNSLPNTTYYDYTQMNTSLVDQTEPSNWTDHAKQLLRLNGVALSNVVLTHIASRVVAIVQVTPYFQSVKPRHICGGTALSSEWIITAAHCVAHLKKSLRLLKVARFMPNTTSGLNHDSHLVRGLPEHPIEKIFVHPNFDRKNILSDDIALVKINSKKIDDILPLGEELGDVSALEQLQPVSSEAVPCLVAGAGRLRHNAVLPHEVENQYLHVAIVTRKSCMGLLNLLNHKVPENVTRRRLQSDTLICAGGQLDDGDTCQGDSGGPLICAVHGSYDHEAEQFDEWYLAGIASSGIGCGKYGIPSIYTRIQAYTQWINSNYKPAIISSAFSSVNTTR